MEKPQSGLATMPKCKDSAWPMQAGKPRWRCLRGDMKDISGKQDGSPARRAKLAVRRPKRGDLLVTLIARVGFSQSSGRAIDGAMGMWGSAARKVHGNPG